MNSLVQHGRTSTYTFLFTDIEGSSGLWEKYPVEMQGVLAEHDRLTREAIESHHGEVVKTTGDGFHAVFATPRDGVLTMIVSQRALQDTDWGKVGSLRVRMALHTGDA
jgi:class 3 adenylate cyclase